MDNADWNPPVPKSMSDWELEQALATAKAQSDGMIAAMILLEQESQLRSEDDTAATAWISDMENNPAEEAHSALQAFLLANPRFSKSSENLQAAPTESPVDPATPNQQSVAASQPESAEPSIVEVEEAPIIPVPIPAPVSQEAAFDELLALGAPEATDAITLPNQDDFSVTGVLGQIVEQVNSEFSADEDATALEESEHEPVGAFASEEIAADVTKKGKAKSQRARKYFDWTRLWSQLNIAGIAVPSFAAFWAATHQASLATILVGTGSAFALNLGFQTLFDSILRKGSKDSVVLSRASFGVFANIVPTVFIFGFRVVALVVALATAIFVFLPTVAGAPSASAISPVAIIWSGVFGLGVLVIALIAALLPSKAKSWIFGISAVSAIAIVVSACSSGAALPEFGSLDVSQMLLIGVFTLLAMLSLSGYDRTPSGQSNEKTSAVTINVVGSFVLPLALAFGFAVIFEGTGHLTFELSAFSIYFLSLPLWLAQLLLVASVIFTIVLTTLLLDFASRPLAALFVANRWVQIAITFGLAVILLTLVSWQTDWFPFLGELLIGLMVPVFAWLGIFVCEGLLRHLPFHEVSLQRGYAFYKRISIVAIFGFLVSVAFGLGVSKIESIPLVGFLAKPLDSILFFDNLSGSVWAFVIAFIWTLVTSIPKIHKQELEIAAIDERRSEIAGVELPQ